MREALALQIFVREEEEKSPRCMETGALSDHVMEEISDAETLGRDHLSTKNSQSSCRSYGEEKNKSSLFRWYDDTSKRCRDHVIL